MNLLSIFVTALLLTHLVMMLVYITTDSRSHRDTALVALILAVALMIAPSLYHEIVPLMESFN